MITLAAPHYVERHFTSRGMADVVSDSNEVQGIKKDLW